MTDVSGTIIGIDTLLGRNDPPPPSQVSLSDILADVSVLRQQEEADKAKFASILNPNLAEIRTKLIGWAGAGFQGSCDLYKITISAPNVCSDGVVRNFFEYIQFVSEKTYLEHLQTIQGILPDFEVVYRCSRTEFVIAVSRVTA